MEKLQIEDIRLTCSGNKKFQKGNANAIKTVSVTSWHRSFSLDEPINETFK